MVAFERHAAEPEAARRAVSNLAAALGWPPPAEADDLADYLFHRLTGFPALELLIYSSPAPHRRCQICSKRYSQIVLSGGERPLRFWPLRLIPSR